MGVGEYVRTKKGIAKIIDKLDDVRFSYPNAWVTDTYLEINDDTEYIYDGDTIKSSPQIIDLIEVGDYVNGNYVTKEVSKDKRKKQIIIVDSTCVEYGDLPLNNDDIKTIVTHEQMEVMEYRVEE